jgi:hypothetical protein
MHSIEETKAAIEKEFVEQEQKTQEAPPKNDEPNVSETSCKQVHPWTIKWVEAFLPIAILGQMVGPYVNRKETSSLRTDTHETKHRAKKPRNVFSDSKPTPTPRLSKEVRNVWLTFGRQQSFHHGVRRRTSSINDHANGGSHLERESSN